MEKLMEKKLERLEGALAEIDLGSPLQRMRLEVSLVRGVMEELKSEVLARGFEGVEQEVRFFKEVKPRFHCLLILANERFHYRNQRPMLAGKELERYGRAQLQAIEQFFERYGLVYHYYRMGSVELDERLFLRENVSDDLVFAGLPEIYPVFSTYGEYLFSKFMALERLRTEILVELSPVAGEQASQVLRSRKGRELRWTGDTCNLIEMAYGLFDTRQLNDGQVDLSDIMEVFEQVFKVNLSRYFRRFTEIKRRKTVSKTKFLDSMVEEVNRRIDEGDAYVPMAMR